MTAITTQQSTHTTVDLQLAEVRSQLSAITRELERQRRERELWTDLAADAGPIADEAMARLTAVLAATDVEGLLAFGRGSGQVLAKVVAAFDEDDLHALGDNIVLILETVREMTQPDVMRLLRRTTDAVREHAEIDEPPPSAFALVRELRDPEVRRGLARVLDLLRSVGDAGHIDLTDQTTQEVER